MPAREIAQQPSAPKPTTWERFKDAALQKAVEWLVTLIALLVAGIWLFAYRHSEVLAKVMSWVGPIALLAAPVGLVIYYRVKIRRLDKKHADERKAWDDEQDALTAQRMLRLPAPSCLGEKVKILRRLYALTMAGGALGTCIELAQEEWLRKPQDPKKVWRGPRELPVPLVSFASNGYLTGVRQLRTWGDALLRQLEDTPHLHIGALTARLAEANNWVDALVSTHNGFLDHPFVRDVPKTQSITDIGVRLKSELDQLRGLANSCRMAEPRSAHSECRHFEIPQVLTEPAAPSSR